MGRSYIVDLSKAHFEAAKGLPMPTSDFVDKGWVGNSENMRKSVEAFKVIEDVIEHGQSLGSSGFNHRSTPEEKNIRDIISAIAERWPRFNFVSSPFQESPFTIRNTLFELAPERPVSAIFYWHLEMYLACVNKLGDAPRQILEIGTGNGELARIFKIAHPGLHYVLMDLPESLFFAETYLRANFPAARCFYATSPEWNTSAIAEHDFIFVPVPNWKPLQGAQLDYALNQGSMQEMPAATVQFYCDLLHQAKVGGFCSINYLPTPIKFTDEWELIWDNRPGALILSSRADFVERAWTRKGYEPQRRNMSTERMNWPDGAWWEIRTIVTRGMRKLFRRAGLKAVASAGINIEDPGDVEAHLRSHPEAFDLDAVDDAYLLHGTAAYSYGDKPDLAVIDGLPDRRVAEVLARLRTLYADIPEAQAKN